MFDGSEPLTREDLALAQRCAGRPAIALVNKEDKPTQFDAEIIACDFAMVLPVCCQEEGSRRVIAAAVARLLGTNNIDPHAASLSGQRQLAAATRARDAVAGALDAVSGGFGLDAVSVCVDDALDALCDLTGEMRRRMSSMKCLSGSVWESNGGQPVWQLLLGHETGHSIARPIACGNRVPPTSGRSSEKLPAALPGNSRLNHRGKYRKSMNHLGDYDVIVIGAGHAGIEAAHAAATLGAKTAVFTMSLDAIGNMPCNPSIGGTAKGTLVRELDALGGVMGLAADATYLQSRMLNKGKGPAVHALRVQTDRKRYHEYMKHALELTPGLAIHQAEVVGIEVENGHVKGVVTQLNGEYSAKCVVVATGTNLGGKIFVGDAWYASGPDGMHAANALTESLKAAGLPLRRFKTGTPARVHRRSIDFSKLECQPGDPDSELQPFSFLTDAPMHNKVECWIAYTNPETHRIILDNIQRSPLYGGMIEGIGPRYCPSIEDKVVRFAGKDRHPIFVEPCGENTEEMYLQGASSSLPEDVQNAFYRSIQGFEHIEIMRPAYAIEYDCVDPTSLEATLESKVVRGLYGAGQFNGTSGYEEAAAQGLLAGLNAARSAKGESQLILERQTSYLGTLVDDLVTKGVMDPYRMMTSRSEYRLTLRQGQRRSAADPHWPGVWSGAG